MCILILVVIHNANHPHPDTLILMMMTMVLTMMITTLRTLRPHLLAATAISRTWDNKSKKP